MRRSGSSAIYYESGVPILRFLDYWDNKGVIYVSAASC